MTPKSDCQCSNLTMPLISISGSKNDTEALVGNTTKTDSSVHSKKPRNCQFAHSFSQSELDHFKTRPSKISDLPSDFLHLRGITLHSDRATEKLHSHDESIDIKHSNKIVVVVPSIDLDEAELRRLCDSIEFYEERQLYYLLLANDPSARIIYLSSNPVSERVVRYYLDLCRDERHHPRASPMDRMCDRHQMLSRLVMINVPSNECIPLSDKILKHTNLLKLLQGLLCSPFNGCEVTSNPFVGLSVFTGSDSSDILSRKLGVRLLEASGDQLHYGTKQGSREIFAACGLNFPKGTPEFPADDDLLSYGHEHGEKTHWAQNKQYIRSARELSIGIARQIMLGVKPRKWMIKLNQGFSGKGNASINLCNIQSMTLPINEMSARIEQKLPKMKFEDPNMTWNDKVKHLGFKTQIQRLGVIAEAFIEGEVPTSPSIQAVIEPNDKRVSIISTHEQLLDGQVYNGCINPANKKYRTIIMDAGLKVGNYLAERGVVGHFSVDFLANQGTDGSWDVHAVEVNLRQGGTTHPHAMMSLLCGGSMCSDGLFRNADGEVRTYIATDTYFNPHLKGCSESQILDAIECKTNTLANTIRWDTTKCIGVIFHLFKFVEKHGRIGFTAIGRNDEEVQTFYNTVKQFLSHVGENPYMGNK